MTPVIVIGAIGLAFVLIVVAVAGVGAFLIVRGKGRAGPGATLLGVNPAVNRASLDRLEAGMSLEEVQAILGSGKAAGHSDLIDAFAGFKDDADKWVGNSQAAGVTAWYRWQNGDESIFVGFAKGRRSGKQRALLAFWVQRSTTSSGMRGYISDPAFTESARLIDPDILDQKRRDEKKMLDDPKWKQGNPRQLIIGRFEDSFRSGYEFRANGTYDSFGFFAHHSTYRFIDDQHIEIMIPGGPGFPPGAKTMIKQYRVFVARDELILLDNHPHAIPLRYKRVR